MTDIWELNVVLLVAVKREWEEIIKLCHGASEIFDFRTYSVEQTEINDDWRLGSVDKKVLELEIQDNLVVKMIIMKLPTPGSGGDAAANLASKAIEIYQPHTICMVGMCAGNPGLTEMGDVILASSIIRHDYGGLSVAKDKKPSLEHSNNFEFEHRGVNNLLKIEDSDVYKYTDFNYYLKEYNKQIKPKFRVQMGVFSTGNQVTRIPNIFDYIEKKVLIGLGGEDEERQLHALEMEAFPVAYSAKMSSEKVGWVIVKGVADFADGNKDKEYQPTAITNSLNFMFWFLPRVVKASFSRQQPEKSRMLSILDEAKRYYKNGDFEYSAAKFKQVYKAGCRSIDARKFYIKCLMRYGDYELAARELKAYSLRPWTADAVTVELLAEISWRQSDYDGMNKLLENLEQLETSQIQYLRALYLIFRFSDHADINEDDLSTTVELLQNAVHSENNQPKFFLNVNLCFALKLQQELGYTNGEELEGAYKIADKIIICDLATYSKRGLLYVYKLLLLAIVDKESEFLEFIKANRKQHLVIALDNVDMVYKRIEILYRAKEEKLNLYLGGLTNFIIRNRQIGKFIRERTERLIHEHQ